MVNSNAVGEYEDRKQLSPFVNIIAISNIKDFLI